MKRGQENEWVKRQQAGRGTKARQGGCKRCTYPCSILFGPIWKLVGGGRHAHKMLLSHTGLWMTADGFECEKKAKKKH